jgi:cell division protein FtsQ
MFARASHGQAVIRQPAPQLPRANWPWLGRGALVIVVLLLLGILIDRLADPATLPIRKIRVQGALVHVDEAMLQASVLGKVHGGYFNVDVAGIRRTVEALPWVRHASVRRVWPDSIAITVVEQQPLARWAGGGLLNRDGELFRPAAASWPAGLPRFTAPAGTSRTVTRRYRAMAAQLASLQLRITALRLDARGALRLQLAGEAEQDFELWLGREQHDLRLARFIKVYDRTLAPHADRIRRIDLRYGNGMAVQWKTTTTQHTATRGG